MSEENPLAGRRAVVTGGGRGIGAAVAERLAAAGAEVLVTARSTEQIEAVAENLKAVGSVAHAVACDISRPEQIADLREEAERLMGGVDILVNNAGVASSAPLAKVTLEDWESMFRINVTGVFLLTQAFLPGMLEGGWGRVVNVASVAGKMGGAYISPYAASKHAVVGFTRAMAVEVAAAGVTFNAVCPGFVDTGMTEETVARITRTTGASAERARSRLEKMSPQGRIYTAAEVAFQVVHLCLPECGGMNGQSIVIDGGSVQT